MPSTDFFISRPTDVEIEPAALDRAINHHLSGMLHTRLGGQPTDREEFELTVNGLAVRVYIAAISGDDYVDAVVLRTNGHNRLAYFILEASDPDNYEVLIPRQLRYISTDERVRPQFFLFAPRPAPADGD